MKRTLRNMMFVLAAMMVVPVFTACDKDDDKDNAEDPQLQVIAENYVNNTIVYTYTQLANNTEQLVKDLQTLKASKTQANLDKVATTFLEARKWWEMSEAFLFGPATNYGIDPHIDSWPLAQDDFDNLMANATDMAKLGAENGDEEANMLDRNLLGFHGLEYVIFKDKTNMDASRVKDVASLTDNNITFAIAVAGDLRNSCYRLEISWAGEDHNKAHAEKLEDLEWQYTVNGGSFSYKENMLNAGKAGSTYVSFAHVMEEIADGCASIADEVGPGKIGTASTAYSKITTDEDYEYDADYVESPYSKNSITDFTNNIISIENAYYGGVKGVNRSEAKSMHNYLKEKNAALDAKIVAAINGALEAIANMPKPFVDNLDSDKNVTAIEACTALGKVMGEAAEWFVE